MRGEEAHARDLFESASGDPGETHMMKLKSLTRSDVSRLADSSLIYARGEEYYQSGAIYQFSSSATGLTAKLHGNYGDYTVKISQASAGLQTECDCPYDGAVCKHIVAA